MSNYADRYQQYIACGYIDGLGAVEDAPFIPIDGASDRIELQDKDGHPWTVVVGWMFVDAVLTPTTIVLQSDTGKSVTRALVAGLPIGEAIEQARTAKVMALAEEHARARQMKWAAGHDPQSEPMPVAVKSKPTGRQMEYGEWFHRRVAEAWFADAGDQRGRVRRVGERLWNEGMNFDGKGRWPMSDAALHARIRKAMKRLKDPNDPWGFIAHTQHTSTKTTGKKR